MGNDVSGESGQTVEPSAVERNQGALQPQGHEAGVLATSPTNALNRSQSPDSDQDAVSCLDCAEPAEFVTFSDPPLAKCFRCALLKAMERLCALCGKHPTECIVRAISENERQDVIGICANCFSKRLSGMRN